MKSRYQYAVPAALMILFSAACQKAVVQEPPSTDASISNFYFTYNYPDTTYANKGTSSEIMSVRVQTINLSDQNYPVVISNDTAYVTPVVPGTGIPAGQLHNIKLSQLWGNVATVATSTVEPLNGSPVLGSMGDFSKPVSYRVNAANGSTKNWVIVTAPLPVLNQYDGYYSYKGYVLRGGDPVLTGNFAGLSMALVTSGLSTVQFATSAIWGDGVTGISAGLPILTVNTDNSVTLASTTGQVYNDPGYQSRYDPASKTFFISFTWGAGPSQRLSTDTLTFAGPR